MMLLLKLYYYALQNKLKASKGNFGHNALVLYGIKIDAFYGRKESIIGASNRFFLYFTTSPLILMP